LFDNGIPTSGDITDRLELVDAGTEVDEYAGAGNNQPTRQVAADTGEEENGTIAIEQTAGAHVPTIDQMIRVTITAN